MSGDLTIKKMREAIALVNGSWPSMEARVSDNEFFINSNLQKLNYEGIDKIKELGFIDVEISCSDDDFNFKFIWKKEAEKKK